LLICGDNCESEKAASKCKRVLDELKSGPRIWALMTNHSSSLKTKKKITHKKKKKKKDIKLKNSKNYNNDIVFKITIKLVIGRY
jgi:predicted MPP superfamily phosphohydrolase